MPRWAYSPQHSPYRSGASLASHLPSPQMCKTIVKLNRAANVNVLTNQTPNANSIHIKRITRGYRNPTCLLILWVISQKCPLWVVDTVNDSSTWSGSSDFAIPTCVLCIPFVCDKLFWLSKYFFWVRSLTISKPYGCLTSGFILPGGACHPLIADDSLYRC